MIGWRVVLWGLLVIGAGWFMYQVRHIVFPFALALLLSAMLEPVCRQLMKRGLNWKTSVWTVWTVLFVAVIGSLVYLTPQFSRQVVGFRDKIESVSTRVAAQTAQDNYFLRWNPRFMVASDPIYAQIDKVFLENQENLRRLGLPTNRRLATSQYIEPYRQQITNLIQGLFQTLLTTAGSIGANAFLYAFVPFFVLMFLLDLERFKAKAAGLVPPSIRSDTVELISDVFDVFLRYLRGIGQVVVWYVLIAAVLLSVLGAPYSLLLAGLFGVIYLIPPIGGFFNLVLLFTLTGLSGKTGAWYYQFPSAWAFAGFVALIYVIVFTLFDALVYTRVVGNSVGLHPLISFFVVFSAGALFGPVGMVFAFPIAGAVKIILDRLIEITSKPTDLHLPPIPMRHRVT